MTTAEDIAARALIGLDSVAGHTKIEPRTTMRDNHTKDSKQAAPTKRRKGPKPKVKLPVEPETIHFVSKRKEYVNHTYRDLSMIPVQIGQEFPTEISEMSFAEKIYDVLSKEENVNFIEWRPHGRAFRISIPVHFEKVVCPKYFGHKRYSSFLRQLNNHGFKLITRGKDRNCYYHECVVRGLPHLCKYISEPKDARRLIPDPDNEPDFYELSRLYPLPDSNAATEEDAKPAAAAAAAAVDELITKKSDLWLASLPSHYHPVLPTSEAKVQSDVSLAPSVELSASTKGTDASLARLASQVAYIGDVLPPAKRTAIAPPIASSVVLSEQIAAAPSLYNVNDDRLLGATNRQSIIERMLFREQQLQLMLFHKQQQQQQRLAATDVDVAQILLRRIQDQQEAELALFGDQYNGLLLSTSQRSSKQDTTISKFLHERQQEQVCIDTSSRGQNPIGASQLFQQQRQLLQQSTKSENSSSIIEFLRRKK